MPASNFASGGEAEGGGLSAGAFAGGDAVAGGGDGCADGTIAAGAAGGAPPVMFTGAAPYRLTRYTPAMIATATTATATPSPRTNADVLTCFAILRMDARPDDASFYNSLGDGS